MAGPEAPAAQPRAVVFDIGNVLYDWAPRYLYAKLIDDPGRLDNFLSRVLTLEWHGQLDAGRDFADAAAELAAAHPEHAGLIEAWGSRFHESIGDPLPGMHELVAELDARRVPLYAISNFSHEFWPPFRAREEAIFSRFRGIVVSGEEKLVKPDPAIFALAMRRFGIGPGTAIFVDDRADNVAAAEASGLIGHVFRDAETLRPVLAAAGLLGPGG